MPAGFTFEEAQSEHKPFSFEETQDTPKSFSFEEAKPSQATASLEDLDRPHSYQFDDLQLAPSDLSKLKEAKDRLDLREHISRVSESPVASVARGVREAAIDTATAMRDPANLGLMAVTAVQPEIGAGILAGLAAKKTGATLGKYSVPIEPSPEAAQEATKDILETVMMAQVPRLATDLAPRTMEALRTTTEKPSTAEVPGAIGIEKTAAVHGDVRKLEEPASALPVEESGSGVQSQTEGGLREPTPIETRPEEAVKPEPSAQPSLEPRVFYDEAVKAYTATKFDEQFGNFHGTGDTSEAAIADLNKHIDEANKHGTWRSVEHPETPPVGEGPGAAPKWFGKYLAIKQLSEHLEAAPPVGTEQTLSMRQKIVEQWAKGKDAVTQQIGRMRDASTWTKQLLRGVRTPNDIDSRLGEYDYATQFSSAESLNAKKVMERQMKDVTDREATAILIDSARSAEDPTNPAEVRQVIADGLARLPKDAPASVRRAMERALDPSLEMRQFSESLKQFYGIREQDAIASDLFSEGLQDYYTHVWKKTENMPSSLKDAIATGRLNTYFQFARQRKIPTLIEGILEGKTPILDPAKVVPFYNYAMDRAIASREFIRQLSDVEASDGRPAVEVRGGARIPDPLDTESPVLVKPKTQEHEINDYQSINHPAMQKWKWLTKTPEGRDVMMRGEMVVHPEFHERLARFMDRSRITPGPVMKGLLKMSSEVKGIKFGVIPSTFHQLHVGLHAAFHWTSPFRGFYDTIDFEAPSTKFAVEKGHLKLAPDPNDLSLFSEGMAASGLVRKIPWLGKWSGIYSDWLFHDYIPRLKLATFNNAMEGYRSGGIRGQLTFTGRALQAGRLSESEVAARVGDAVNNAYGELNHLFLGRQGRNPIHQRLARLTFLAPDFGEARARFAGKAATKFGDEERIALLTMATTLYATARFGNWMSHGDAEMDPRHAFEVKVGKNWLSVRSVIGDIVHLIQEPGQFSYVRLNPLFGRPSIEFLTGREARTGRRLNTQDHIQRIAESVFEPIGAGGLTEPDRRLWQSFAQSMGLANRRDLPVSEVLKKAAQWRHDNGLAPMSEQIPTDEPSYLKLRTALNLGATGYAKKLLTELRKTRSDTQINKAMIAYVRHPFTGSKEHERAFIAGLNEKDSELYMRAVTAKQETLNEFYKLIDSMEAK